MNESREHHRIAAVAFVSLLCASGCGGRDDADVGASADVGSSDADTTEDAATAGFDAHAMEDAATMASSGLVLTPTPFDFGDVFVGEMASQTFTGRNSGEGSSGIVEVRLSGLDGSQYALGADSCTGTSVPSGGMCSVEVIYQPTSAGIHSGSLALITSEASWAALQGRASHREPPALRPSSVDFGPVGLGRVSAPQELTLSNLGGEPLAAVFTHSLSGADADEFEVVASTCDDAPLAAGASCTLSVTFAPRATVGARVASLDLTDGTSTASSALTGTGLVPHAGMIDPSVHDFGVVAVGATSSVQEFVVRNVGDAPTGVLSTAIAGTNPADFRLAPGGDGCNGVSLAALSSCAISIEFVPSAAGARTATLRVTSTSEPPMSAALTGTGT